ARTARGWRGPHLPARGARGLCGRVDRRGGGRRSRAGPARRDQARAPRVVRSGGARVIRLKHLAADNFKSLRDVEIAFPADGRVLIEGVNESGKSPLFEAVYFALYGRPLLTGATIESTIRYRAQQSLVVLSLLVGATEIEVVRDTRLGRPNRAKLTITRPGEQ